MERIIKGITFELPTVSAAMDAYMKELAEQYDANVSKIMDCMLGDPGVAERFRGMTKEQMVEKLGIPTIRPWQGADGCEISYIEGGADEMQVLSVECSGVYEDFAYGPTANS